MTTNLNIHPDEAALAAMARSGEPADAHLEACPRCRKLFDFYRSYLVLEAEELRRPVSARDVERANGILSPGVYRLEPFQVHLNVRTPEGSYSPVLLAALERDAGTRFVTIATFASQAIQTVVRIVRDTRLNTQTLHVLATDEAFRREVEVRIGDASGQLIRLRTDADGAARLPERTALDWTSVRLMLFAPTPSR